MPRNGSLASAAANVSTLPPGPAPCHGSSESISGEDGPPPPFAVVIPVGSQPVARCGCFTGAVAFSPSMRLHPANRRTNATAATTERTTASLRPCATPLGVSADGHLGDRPRALGAGERGEADRLPVADERHVELLVAVEAEALDLAARPE